MTNYSKLKDKTLISRIKNKSDSEAVLEIIRRHERIVYKVINRFCSHNTYINKEEILDDKYSIFQYAINSYKNNKNTKFSSWLYLNTRFWILNHYKDADKTYTVENKTIDDINNENNRFQLCGQNNKDNTEYIQKILEQMEDKRIKTIFKMRYFDGVGNKVKDWKSIGKEIGLSITRVISLHEQGKKLLLKKINSIEKSDTI